MKTTTVMIRVSDIEKGKWIKAAAARGMSLSEYIRFVVNSDVEKEEKKNV